MDTHSKKFYIRKNDSDVAINLYNGEHLEFQKHYEDDGVDTDFKVHLDGVDYRAFCDNKNISTNPTVFQVVDDNGNIRNVHQRAYEFTDWSLAETFTSDVSFNVFERYGNVAKYGYIVKIYSTNGNGGGNGTSASTSVNSTTGTNYGSYGSGGSSGKGSKVVITNQSGNSYTMNATGGSGGKGGVRGRYGYEYVRTTSYSTTSYVLVEDYTYHAGYGGYGGNGSYIQAQFSDTNLTISFTTNVNNGASGSSGSGENTTWYTYRYNTGGGYSDSIKSTTYGSAIRATSGSSGSRNTSGSGVTESNVTGGNVSNGTVKMEIYLRGVK